MNSRELETQKRLKELAIQKVEIQKKIYTYIKDVPYIGVKI